MPLPADLISSVGRNEFTPLGRFPTRGSGLRLAQTSRQEIDTEELGTGCLQTTAKPRAGRDPIIRKPLLEEFPSL